jgi:hypothetical protein
MHSVRRLRLEIYAIRLDLIKKQNQSGESASIFLPLLSSPLLSPSLSSPSPPSLPSSRFLSLSLSLPQTGPELKNFLPQSPELWDCRLGAVVCTQYSQQHFFKFYLLTEYLIPPY